MNIRITILKTKPSVFFCITQKWKNNDFDVHVWDIHPFRKIFIVFITLLDCFYTEKTIKKLLAYGAKCTPLFVTSILYQLKLFIVFGKILAVLGSCTFKRTIHKTVHDMHFIITPLLRKSKYPNPSINLLISSSILIQHFPFTFVTPSISN